MYKGALAKYSETFKKACKIPVSFRVMDSHKLEYPDEMFDSVVETFGLCSHVDPVKTLEEYKRVTKDHGYIFLLEHGRSSFEWLNTALDRTSLEHARKWGICLGRTKPYRMLVE
jgi:ubiquinone/menaquinone biosynthesis C-methylase UbiE